MSTGHAAGVRARFWTAATRALLCAGLVMSAGACEKSEASAYAEKSPAPARAPVGRCGDKGLPDCPTQAWMKATLQPFLLSSDTAHLADALERLAAAAPAGYDDWASIARAGAKAAKAGDMMAVKESCASCHNKHRARFKTELRQQPIL